MRTVAHTHAYTHTHTNTLIYIYIHIYANTTLRVLHMLLLVCLTYRMASLAAHGDRTPCAFKDPKPATPEQAQSLDAEHWREDVCVSIRASLQVSDVDSAFNLWTRQAERFCASLATMQDLPVCRKHFGRGQTPKVVQTPVQAPPASPDHWAADVRLASMIKLERKFSQLCSKLRSNPCSGSEAHQQLLNLCTNIQQAWARLFPDELCCISNIVPSFQEVNTMQEALAKRLVTYQQSLRDHHIDQHKSRLIQDWSQGSRKLTYAWVRDTEPYTTPCFQHPNQKNEYITKHAELHQMMLKDWSPLFNRYLDRQPPQYSDFIAEFPESLSPLREHTAHNPFSLPRLNSQMITDTIKNLKPTAPGADGWNVCEMQSLSHIAIELLTEIFNTIELCAIWPSTLFEVPVAALRKGEGSSPLDIRPISLTPILYRIWARARFFTQLQPWHVQWLPSQLRGGAPGRDAVDAFYDLALEAEFCAQTNRPLYGVLYDYTKCFDLVAWPVEKGLLTDLGMPLHVLEPMYAYAANIQRRFKLGSCVGPKFSNTNSISQGCPLAILRINALTGAWARAIANQPSLTQCSVGGYVDDRNLRSTSLQQLHNAIHISEKFDKATDAVLNLKKTHLFATTTASRKQLSSIKFDGREVTVVKDDKLLGGHLSFTQRRARWLADERAKKYQAVAKRIALCPLNYPAKHTLLATAGATKFNFGLELGSCTRKLEKQVRKVAINAVWAKRASKSNDIALTLCFKGHKTDPTQLKFIQPFITARRQLKKHPHIFPQWAHIWLVTQQNREKFNDFRSNAVGPSAVLFQAAREMAWDWVEPLVFKVPLGHSRCILLHLTDLSDEYFLHILRWGASSLLWRRAAATRKDTRGIQQGVDKNTTLQVLNSNTLLPYDQGILRAILAGGITTQVSKFHARVVSHTACPFCWRDPETTQHLFWKCPHWQQIRLTYLTEQQLRTCLDLPPCTQRTGIFPLTPEQADAMVQIHSNCQLQFKPESLPASPCEFAANIHRVMVAIVRARKEAEEQPVPDDFDPKPFTPARKKSKTATKPSPHIAGDDGNDDNKSPPQSALNNPPQVKPTHDEEGLLLSTSMRPGGSKFQYVQFKEKEGKFKAVVPHQAKRHTVGLFDSDVSAARAVKAFLDALEHGHAPMSRGEKRTAQFNAELNAKLTALNMRAREERRHHVKSAEEPTCKWCGKSVHRFYAQTFAESLCPTLSPSVDKSGSLTRAQNLSKTSTQALKRDVETHNKNAPS